VQKKTKWKHLLNVSIWVRLEDGKNELKIETLFSRKLVDETPNSFDAMLKPILLEDQIVGDFQTFNKH